MHLFSILSFLTCLVLINADYLPVLSNLNTNKEITIGQAVSFDSILSNLKSNQNLQVIIVDNLNNQDLEPLIRKTTFSNKNIEYFPLVENPSDSLDIFVKKNPSNNIKITHSSDINDAFFKFMDAVSNSASIILTGSKSAPASLRVKRQSEDTNNNPTLKDTINNAFGSQCAASFNKVYLIDSSVSASSTPINLVVFNNATFSCDGPTSVLTLYFDPNNAGIQKDPIKQIDLNFRVNNQYWIFLNGTLTTGSKLYGLRYMEAPYSMETPNNFSFVCTRTHYRLYDPVPDNKPYFKIDFFIDYLQMQPFGVQTNGTSYTFGKVNYCQGYFSNGIWMAITSSLLLTVILAFGVSMLFSIKTMDRFDDPKGKPLNIAMEK